MRVKDGFWMGRTEVSVGQFRRFADETGYVSDAEKPGGHTQVFDPEWKDTTGDRQSCIPGNRWQAKVGAIRISGFRCATAIRSSA